VVETRFPLHELQSIPIEKWNPVVGVTQGASALEEADIDKPISDLSRLLFVNPPGVSESLGALLRLRPLKSLKTFLQLGVLGE
jgi:hypothetical protein